MVFTAFGPLPSVGPAREALAGARDHRTRAAWRQIEAPDPPHRATPPRQVWRPIAPVLWRTLSETAVMLDSQYLIETSVFCVVVTKDEKAMPSLGDVNS
jgi:hypothetical protein